VPSHSPAFMPTFQTRGENGNCLDGRNWMHSTLIQAAAWLCLVALASEPVSAQPQSLRVRLFASHAPESAAIISGPFEIRGPATTNFPAGNYQVREKNGLVDLQGTSPENRKSRVTSHALIVRGTSKGGLAVRYGQSSRHYPGLVTITVSSQSQTNSQGQSPSRASAPHLVLVNEVSRTDYAAGVCASEMPETAPLEALKAQVVLVNSELARYGRETLVDDTTQRQSYIGLPTGRPLVRRAVQEVGQKSLLFKGVPVKPYYHSTCAGMTSNAYDIFRLSKESYPYLRATKCDYCRSSPFFNQHLAEIPEPAFAAVFGGEVPRIKEMDAAGRPLVVSYSVHGWKTTVSAYSFWTKLGQRFGWDKAPGNLFSLQRNKPYIRIESRGAGHGVGMCQWGAIGMAEKGKDYKQILQYYFNGTTVSP
jgi:stage II sporulation protein D